jgi:hypothetical protein
MSGPGGVVFASTWAFCDTQRILSRREIAGPLPKHELMNFLETRYDMYHATFNAIISSNISGIRAV